MQSARQRRLRRKLRLSQLCGEAPCGLFSQHTSHVEKQFQPDVLVPAQGSYHCGSCKTGFTGDQVKGCKPEISCGNSLTNPCDANAQCIAERDGSVHCQVGYSPLPPLTTCTRMLHVSTTACAFLSESPLPPQCGIGWAGNGFLCGKDTDIDGYPDEKLKCKDLNCKKVIRGEGGVANCQQKQLFLRYSGLVSLPVFTVAHLHRTTACSSPTRVRRMRTGMVMETPVTRMPTETRY